MLVINMTAMPGCLVVFSIWQIQHMAFLKNPRQLLIDLYLTAVAAVSADKCLPSYLPLPPESGRTLVIGAGKGAAAMAKAVEVHYNGEVAGLVVTRYAHEVETKSIEVVQAAHPVPDEAGQRAAMRMMDMVKGLTEKDLVLCLISGGASALLSMPAKGVTLEEKQNITRALLRRGATISEMNCVRKHLSQIKGGRLALVCAPARVVTLMISDIPGDDPGMIASGPTLPDPTTCTEALAIVKKYRIDVPENIQAHLENGKWETPKPGDARFAHNESHIIARPQDALDAAARMANASGIATYILSDRVEGQARDIALMHAAIARQVVKNSQPFSRPCLILSGGETTVTVRGNGRGGRNTEFLLSFALAMEALPGVYAIACDTDGIDGILDNAGALYMPDSLSRAGKKGLNARMLLEDNDGYRFFSELGDLLVTGPSRTNVNDFRAILIT